MLFMCDLRAFETLGFIVPFYLLLFASTDYVMEVSASAANFTQPLTRTDALYFSVTVFATVGFGDAIARQVRDRTGSCSSSRCSPTSRCWAPAKRRCWGRCAAGHSADPAQADGAGPAPR